jgi:hypothetical protein
MARYDKGSEREVRSATKTPSNSTRALGHLAFEFFKVIFLNLQKIKLELYK